MEEVNRFDECSVNDPSLCKIVEILNSIVIDFELKSKEKEAAQKGLKTTFFIISGLSLSCVLLTNVV